MNGPCISQMVHSDNIASSPQVLTSLVTSESELEPLLSPTTDTRSLTDYRSISAGIDDEICHNSNRRQYKHGYIWLGLLFLIFLAFSLFIYDLRICMQNLALVTIIDVDNISIDTDSANPFFNISASFVFNYSDLNSTFMQIGFLGLSRFIGSIKFYIGDVTKMSVSKNSHSTVHLWDLIIPDSQRAFEIDIHEGKRNEISLTNIQTELDYGTLSDFMNAIFDKRSLPEQTRLYISTDIDNTFLHNHLVEFGYVVPSLNVSRIITQFESNVRISNISFGTDNSSSSSFANGSAILSLPKSDELFFLSFKHIPSLLWRADLKCSTKNSDLSRLITANIPLIQSFYFNESHEVNVSYGLSLDHELFEHYENQFDNLTPFNYYANKFLDGKLVPLYMHGCSTQDFESQSWLEKLLTLLIFKIYVGSRQFLPSDVLSNPVKNVSISKVSIGPHNGDLIMSVDPMIVLNSDYVGFDFDVPRVKGNIDVGDKFDSLCEFHVSSWCDSLYDPKHSTFKLLLDDFFLRINDGESLGKKLNQLLNGTNQQFDVRANFDFEINMPPLNTIFQDVPISTVAHIPSSLGNVTDVFSSFAISLHQITFMESSYQTISLELDLNLKNRSNLTIQNDFEWLEFQILYLKSVISNIGVRKFSISNEMKDTINLRLSMTLKSDANFGKLRLEEFVGQYISGVSPEIQIQGIPGKTAPESESFSKLLESLKLSLTVPQITREKSSHDIVTAGSDQESLFIVDSIIHVVSSEIELTVYNPVQNHAVAIVILSAKASHDGTTLGFVSQEQGFLVPPGLYKTPRIPVTITRSGLGADILRGALNGDLDVDTQAILDVKLGNFAMTLLYRGSGVKTNIRL